jgi:hypothetical protein
MEASAVEQKLEPCDARGGRVKFAKAVFVTAGVWGLLVLTPLYFMFDIIGGRYPPPMTHPDFYFGFLAVTLAWQVAFLVIGRDPIRFRPMMVPAMLEKFIYVGSLGALYLQRRLVPGQVVPAMPDLILGILFIVAFLKTSGAGRQPPGSPLPDRTATSNPAI